MITKGILSKGRQQGERKPNDRKLELGTPNADRVSVRKWRSMAKGATKNPRVRRVEKSLRPPVQIKGSFNQRKKRVMEGQPDGVHTKGTQGQEML